MCVSKALEVHLMQQLEMLKHMRRFPLDEQSAILEKVCVSILD